MNIGKIVKKEYHPQRGYHRIVREKQGSKIIQTEVAVPFHEMVAQMILERAAINKVDRAFRKVQKESKCI